MATKNKLLIVEELYWMEQQLAELKEYIDSNPHQSIVDRTIIRPGKWGDTIFVVSSKEAQRKDLAAALKDYATLLEAIQRLRSIEETVEALARGDKEIPVRMKKREGGD